MTPFAKFIVNSFVYGGWGGIYGPSAVQFDTISILTIPEFHWVSVPYYPRAPRIAHTCHGVGGGQVLVVGGLDSSYDDSTGGGFRGTWNKSRDPFSQGLGVYNMTSLSWQDLYSSDPAPYVRSSLIEDTLANSALA